MGPRALSVNFFMYRKRGVLIGYLLCSRCATTIHNAGRRNPFRQIPLHARIEQRLIEEYESPP